MNLLNKKRTKRKTTTCNKEYRIATISDGVECPVCFGPCGSGPKRANKHKRNCGKKPRYKNINRKSIRGGILWL